MAYVDHPLQRLILSAVNLGRSIQKVDDRAYPGSSLSRRTALTFLLQFGPQTVSDLAFVDGTSRQHMERVIRSAVGDTMVFLEPNPSRRRSVVVCLTGRGYEYAARIVEETKHMCDWIASANGFNTLQTEQCSAMLRRVRYAIDQDGWMKELEAFRRRLPELPEELGVRLL